MKVLGNGCSALLFASHVLAYLIDDKLNFSLGIIELLKGKTLSKLNIEREAQKIIIKYEKILGPRKFDYIVVGAPSGGISHFSMAINAPYLPCHFLKTPIYRRNWWLRSNDPDDIKKYFKRSMEIINAIWKINKDCEIIIHYDPIHDRWIVSNGNTLRFKFQALPQAYKQFIRNHLNKDGTIIFTNVQQLWGQYIIRDRLFFQVGGANGYSYKDFIQGSSNIDLWLQENKSKHRGGWDLNQYNLGTFEIQERPESEWGNPLELKNSTEEFCVNEGFNYLCISTNNYNLSGLLGTYAFYRKFRKSNHLPRGFGIEIYVTGLNSAISRSHYLPIWLVFTPKGSLGYLERFLIQLNKDLPDVPSNFLLVPFPAGFKTQKPHWPDSVLLSDWKKTIQNNVKELKMLQVLGYKKGEIKTGILGQAFKMPKIFEEAYNWGRKFSLEKTENLDIEDIKWVINKSGLKIEPL